MAKYRELSGIEDPEWFHLTGDYVEIEQLRRSLGAYDLDPEIDADRDEHAGIITFGNDVTNWWIALPALMDAKEIAETIVRITAPKRGVFRRG